MRILFQGDSITDADRNRADYHDLGQGYPKYAAKYLREMFPDKELEFIDLGISGDQTRNLLDRKQTDFIDIKPDIVSIMIGINDTWHRAETRDWLPHEEFERNYRELLEAITNKTDAKIVIIEPFLLPAPDKTFFREDLDPKIHIVRRLAREYADMFIPLDGLLASYWVSEDYRIFSEDGVHPTYGRGADCIGRIYADYVSELIRKIG